MTPTPLILFASVLLLPETVLALSFKSSVDFNAHYQSYKADWVYTNNSTQHTSISRWGIGWSEKLAEYIDGGLKVGYLDISQANNPISTAQITTGHYLGIHLGSTPVNIEWFRLSLGLAYTYNNTERQETSQNIELVWNQTVVNIQAAFQFVPRLTFNIGGKLGWIDGEERATGTITQVRSFEQDKITGYSAGVELATDSTGSIGVNWVGGNQEGVNVYFRRRF